MHHHDIVAISFDRQRVEIALAKLHVAETAAVDPLTGEVQHGVATVDPDGAIDPGCQQFQHAAGAGPEIEQSPERARTDGVEDRALDPVLRHMQRPHLVPMRSLGRKVMFGRG